MTQEVQVIGRAVEQESSNVFSVIERMAMNPDVDIEKLQKMMDMQERILNREALQAFSADMAVMQTELPRVAENGKGHNDKKYALLEDINAAIRPALQKYGFAVTFRTSQDDKSVVVTAILSHRGGHREETQLVLPADTTGSKSSVQAIGSSVSYGKRYTLCALLNISTGDDLDGAENQLEEAKETLRQCESMESLTSTFSALWSAYAGDNKARVELTKAKDERKKELANG